MTTTIDKENLKIWAMKALKVLSFAAKILLLCMKHYVLAVWWLFRVEIWVFYYWCLGRWLFGLSLYFPKYYGVWFKKKPKYRRTSSHSSSGSRSQTSFPKIEMPKVTPSATPNVDSAKRNVEIAKKSVEIKKKHLENAKSRLAHAKAGPNWKTMARNYGYPGKGGGYTYYETDVFHCENELNQVKRILEDAKRDLARSRRAKR